MLSEHQLSSIDLQASPQVKYRYPKLGLESAEAKFRPDSGYMEFLRASALGAERVNSSYRQNQRDEGVGLVCNFLETFVNTSFLVGFLSQVS